MIGKLIRTILLLLSAYGFGYTGAIGELVRELLLWEQLVQVVCVLYTFGYFVYLGYESYKDDKKDKKKVNNSKKDNKEFECKRLSREEIMKEYKYNYNMLIILYNFLVFYYQY